MKATIYVILGFIGLGLFLWLCSLGYAWWEKRRFDRMSIGERLEWYSRKRWKP